MITAAAAIVETWAEFWRTTVMAFIELGIEICDAIAQMLELPPMADSYRWKRARGATWPMAPDTIEVAGQFTNLPDGADVARWSATPADWIAQGTSFYAEHMVRRDALAADVLAEAAASDARAASAAPSITVTCQYCAVGGQDPERGYCGQCGGPFPELPRRLGTTIMVERPPDSATIWPAYAELTRGMDGRITSLVRPAPFEPLDSVR